MNLDKGGGTVGASVDSRNVTINTGGTVNDYNGPATMTVGTLNLNGGSLTNTSGTGGTAAGQFKVTVSTDYTNANWGSGNSFNPTAGVSGNTVIDAAGTGPFQTITGSAVSNGATAAPTLALGAVHVGDSTLQSFAIMNTGKNDPSLRGAVQTTGLTDGRLSGVTAGNFGPIASGSSTGSYTVNFSATHAGALSGQSIAVVSNFANVGTQTIAVTGAAYHYADPVWSETSGAGTFSGSGDAYTLDLGTLKNGVMTTADLEILNQLYADDPSGLFTDLLDGSFTTQVVSGKAFDLTGFGDFSGIAAGDAVDQTVAYDLSGGPAGTYEEIITFAPTSYDTPLGDFEPLADHADRYGQRCSGAFDLRDDGARLRRPRLRRLRAQGEGRAPGGPLRGDFRGGWSHAFRLGVQTNVTASQSTGFFGLFVASSLRRKDAIAMDL